MLSSSRQRLYYLWHTITNTTTGSRRHVWHAGFEMAKEAQQVLNDLKLLQTQLQQQHSTDRETEEQLRPLQEKYHQLTGEWYSEDYEPSDDKTTKEFTRSEETKTIPND